MIVALILGSSTVIDFSLLVRLADRYAKAERVDQPIPSEIVKALADSRNRERFTAPKERVVAEVCRLMRASGDLNVFQDELEALEPPPKASDNRKSP